MIPVERLYNIALRTAQASVGVRKVRICAVGSYRNSIYIGLNSWLTHPKQARFARNPHSIYLHAEIACLIRAKWRIDQLVIVRVSRDNKPVLAKPCAGCRQAIPAQCQIFYTTDLGVTCDVY